MLKNISILSFFIFTIFSCSDDSPVAPKIATNDTIIDTIFINDSLSDSYPIRNVNYIDTLSRINDGLTGYNLQSISFGEIIKQSAHTNEIILKDDDVNLSNKWRYWWYTPLVLEDISSQDTIIISNRGWSTFFVPVYSYDQENWFYFDEKNVKKLANNEIKIVHKFTNKEVWVARFYPYTLEDLNKYISKIISDDLVKVDVVGMTISNNPINRITITNGNIDDKLKKTVIIHTRTHPAETGESFVIEGVIDTLLNGNRSIFDSLIIVIIPLYNVDGVVDGNTRTNANSINLEQDWHMQEFDSLELNDEAQIETKTLRDVFVECHNVKIALNLHCSNTDENGLPFFFYHFGDDTLSLDSSEIALYSKMKTFGDLMKINYAPNKIESINSGAGFVNNNYPESWWWTNYKADVMAMTMETTYSKAGRDHWINKDDMKDIGKSLAVTILGYLAVEGE